MTCAKCRKENSEENLFCSYCEFKLKESEEIEIIINNTELINLKD